MAEQMEQIEKLLKQASETPQDKIGNFSLGNQTFEELMNKAIQISPYRTVSDYSLQLNFDFNVDEDPIKLNGDLEEEDQDDYLKKLRQENDPKTGQDDNFSNLFKTLDNENKEFKALESKVQTTKKAGNQTIQKAKKQEEKIIMIDEPLSYSKLYPKIDKPISNPIELFNALDQYEEIDSNPSIKINKKYYPLANNATETVILNIIKKEELKMIYDQFFARVESDNLKRISNDTEVVVYTNYCINPNSKRIAASTSCGKIVIYSYDTEGMIEDQQQEVMHKKIIIEDKKTLKRSSIKIKKTKEQEALQQQITIDDKKTKMRSTIMSNKSKDTNKEIDQEVSRKSVKDNRVKPNIKTIYLNNANVITALDCYEDIFVAGNDKGDFYIIDDYVVEVLNDCSRVTAIKVLSLLKIGKTKKINIVVGLKETSVQLFTIEYKKSKIVEIRSERVCPICENDLAVCIECYLIQDHNSEKDIICMVGTLTEVYFARIKLTVNSRSIDNMSSFKRPPRNECDYPDICILRGLPPCFNQHNKNKPLKQNETNEKYLATYFCISWGREVYGIEFKSDNGEIKRFEYATRYSHSAVICRIVTISDSLIGIFDQLNNFTIIASYQMRDETQKDKKEINFRTLEIKPIHFTSESILVQKYALKSTRIISTYKYSIIPYEKGIVVFEKKAYHHFTLKTWLESVKELIDHYEWHKAFLLMKDIFIARVCLGESPQEYYDLIGDIDFQSMRLISAYLLFYDKLEDKNKCFLMAIELFSLSEHFCLFLDLIISAFENDSEQLNLLIECLEHYILTDQLSTFILPDSLFLKILKKYKDNPIYLCNLLFHLNVNLLKKNEKAIEEANLYHVLIYSYISDKEFNLTKPISNLIKKWEEASKHSYICMDDYKAFIREKTISTYNDSVMSSPYSLLHLVLWYINYCLDGYIYPSKQEMTLKTYEEIVIAIAVWLNSNQAVGIFTPFDSFSYFQVLSRLFIDLEIYTIISSATIDDINKLKTAINPSRNSIKLVYNPESLLDPLKTYFTNEPDISLYAKKDYYSFILNTNVNKRNFFNSNEIFNAIEFLLNYNQLRKKNSYEEDQDPFYCHHEDIFEFETLHYKNERMILSTLEQFSLSNESLNRLLLLPGLSDFLSIQILLNDKANNYLECLKAHLARYTEDKFMPNKEKKRLLFDWINHSFNSLSSKEQTVSKYKKEKTTISNSKPTTSNDNFLNRSNSQSYKIESSKDEIQIESNEGSQDNRISFSKFKEIILVHLITLLRLSIEETFTLIDNWFSDKHYYILHQLDEFSDLQLKFVEKCLLPYNDKTINSLTQEEKKYYYSLIKMQIILNCDLNQEEKNYAIIQNNKLIMEEEIISLLIDKEVIECALFLYLLFGGFQQGVKLAARYIQTIYGKLNTNLIVGKVNESIHQNCIRKLEVYIEHGVKLCAGSLEKESSVGINHEIWIELINVLYEIYHDIVVQAPNYANNEKTFNFNQIRNLIVNSIKVFLNQISSYMETTILIEQLTQKCKLAVSKELKYILLESISKNHQILTILNNAQMLFIHLVEKNITSMLVGLTHGIEVVLERCNKCNAHYDLSDTIILFKCGHKFHTKCVQTVDNNQMICYTCKLEESEKGFYDKVIRKGFIELNQELPEVDENLKVKKREDNHLKRLTTKLIEKSRLTSYVMDLVSDSIYNSL